MLLTSIGFYFGDKGINYVYLADPYKQYVYLINSAYLGG